MAPGARAFAFEHLDSLQVCEPRPPGGPRACHGQGPELGYSARLVVAPLFDELVQGARPVAHRRDVQRHERLACVGLLREAGSSLGATLGAHFCSLVPFS